MKTLSAILLLLAAWSVPHVAHALNASEDVYWDSSFPERPNQFTDVIVARGDHLFFGGNFGKVGDMRVNYVACWDGHSWTRLGTVTDNGIGTPDMGLCHAIAFDGDLLYAGGMFDQVGPFLTSNIARYELPKREGDPGRWLPLGEGTDRAVRNIKVAANGDVYATGEFTSAGGKTARGIARWDGQEWHDVGGSFNVRARGIAMAIDGDNLYVGGFFSSAGGVPVNNIARWDGTQWHALGSGTDNVVTHIMVHEGRVYAGGGFTTAGGMTAKGLAMWDGTRWNPVGGGLSAPGLVSVRSMLMDDGMLYVGGFFTHAGNKRVNNIARWTGSEWQPLGSGADQQVKVITKYRGTFWVGGNFREIGGKESPFFARWTKGVATFDRLDARSVEGAVHVSWDVTANDDIAGFNVYRRLVSGGDEVQLNAALLPRGSREFVDAGATLLDEYGYRVSVKLMSGVEVMSPERSVRVMLSKSQLFQNFPNPFNPTTVIRYVLPVQSRTTLHVYSVSGRLVRTLVNEVRGAGPHEVQWDGRDNDGDRVAGGVYFYRLETPSATISRKMILLK